MLKDLQEKISFDVGIDIFTILPHLAKFFIFLLSYKKSFVR